VIGAIAFQVWQLQPRKTMTKKIERSRVEAGKAELPKKVSFLGTEKVDYLLVIDRDGDLSVEVAAAALAKLVKARGELKERKAAQKQSDAAAAAALALEKEAHLVTQAALDKAERRVKALEKKLEASTTKPAAAAPFAAAAPAVQAKRPPKKSAKSNIAKKAAVPKESEAVEAVADGAETLSSPSQERSSIETAAAPVVATNPSVV
jgi:hypothetical protein